MMMMIIMMISLSCQADKILIDKTMEFNSSSPKKQMQHICVHSSQSRLALPCGPGLKKSSELPAL